MRNLKNIFFTEQLRWLLLTAWSNHSDLSRFAFIKKFGLQFPSCFFVQNSRVTFSWNKKHFLQLSHSKVLGPLLKYIKQPQDLRRSFCLVEKSITVRHLSDNRFSSKNAHNLAERVYFGYLLNVQHPMATEHNKENLCRWQKSLILNTFLLAVKHSGWRE